MEKHPHKEAVVYEERSFTYQEIGLISLQLAVKLRQAGLKPKTYIGICFPKSVLSVVSILAIQLLGAAFVPLDPAAPPARWQSVLEAVDAKVVLCPQEFGENLQDVVERTILLTNDDLITLQGLDESQSTLDAWKSFESVSPSDASFVIFTSGSTGKPKGIAMQHDATCSTSDGYAKELGIGPASRVYHFSSLTFDMGVLDIFVTLMRGGCICIPTEDERWNALASSMTRLKANTVFLTPTVADILTPADVPYLEHLILAGEAVSQTLANRWQGVINFHGGYGPTETSVCAISDQVVNDKQHKVGIPTNCTFWVIDPNQPTHLVPDGCIGELLVQGPILAREYISAGEQANQNWVRDHRGLPSGIPVEKAYRTGDLVRKCEDGTYDYIGRKDTQVKIRGQRIELGEIEVQLSLALPDEMRGFVQVLKGEMKSLDSLAAFVWYVDGPHAEKQQQPVELFPALSSEQKLSINSIQSALKDRLPPYMIPSTFFLFEGCPEQTISGKVDRKLLLARGQLSTPEQRRLFSSHQTDEELENEIPTTNMELRLRTLWAAVLGMPSEEVIGKQDHFFRLGGDSVSAIRLAADSDRSGIALTVAGIFENPRLVDMALAAASELTEGNSTSFMMTAEGNATQSIKPFSMLPPHLNLSSMSDEICRQCDLGSQDMIQDLYPCSALQEGLMATSLRRAGSYMEKLVYKLPKEVDVAHFKASWEKTIQLSDILRTRIVLIAEEAVALQAVVQTTVDWPVFEDVNSAIETLGSKNLSYGSTLNYCAVVKEEGEDSPYFVWVVHHALHDAWTLRNILRLLERLYWQEDLSTYGQHQEYTMFIKYLTTLNKAKAESFWRKRLSGARPASYPRVTYKTNGAVGGTKSQYRTTYELPVFADTSITKASVIQAAWGIVLARYSDMDDICFGLTVSGRQAPLPTADQVIGPMIATVPVRVRLDRENASVAQYLQTVQDQAVEMIRYEQFGLQNIAKLGSDTSDACQFSSLLVLQPADVLKIVGESSEENKLLRPARGSDMFLDYMEYPLVLQAFMNSTSVDLVFTYDLVYMTDSQCQTLANQLQYVVDQLACNISAPLSSVTLAGPWDIEQAIEWNAEITPIVDSCLHEVVLEVTKTYGDRPAIFTTEETWTYTQVNQLATSLANYLSYNVKAERGSIIPICFSSSKWAIIAMLGILKAGCAFVPIDPAHPENRKRLLIDKVNARTIISSEDFISSCPELPFLHPVELSQTFFSQLSPVEKTADNITSTQLSSEEIAYVLFTSGTTGEPKGVVVQHAAICTSIHNYRSKFAVNDSIRTLQFSNYAFDASIYEIFMTLSSGGTICIPSSDSTVRLQNLSTFMNEAAVNFAMLTPSLVRTLQPSSLPHLSTLMLIGEAPTADLIEIWKTHGRLLNGYGPTECIVLSNVHQFSDKESTTALKSPTVIGKNLHGSGWIVEPDNPNSLAPIGCVGELVIQSPALAQGYYQSAERTAAAFFDGISWSSNPLERAYKTGDLVRYVQDGKIEYIGRKDTQIKLRGQRLELGEIEYNINKAAINIKNATVHLLQHLTGDILVAFIEFDTSEGSRLEPRVDNDNGNLRVLDTHMKAVLSDLKETLKGSLPSYMVPSFLLPIKSMPLGSTLKADRQALQRLAESFSLEDLASFSSLSNEGEKIEPNTEKEYLLRNLWAQILRINPDDISRTDRFLHIGGDSISAIHLTVLARNHGLDIPISAIFSDSTLESMAESADDIAAWEDTDDISSPSQFSLLQTQDVNETVAQLYESCGLEGLEEVQDAYPCTPLQEGLLALGVKHPGSYIAKHVYRLAHNIDLERFKSAWELIYNTCDSQRLRIVKLNQLSIQVLCTRDFEWEHTNGLNLSQFLDKAHKMTMSYGDKLTRSAIVQDPDSGEKYFIWINHHAIFDGWTISLILTALREAYEGVQITPFVPYSGFVQYANSLNIPQAQEYWKKQLHEANQSDFPPKVSTSNDSKEQKSKTKKVTHVISASFPFPSATKTSITKGTILRAAWAICLARYGNTDDVCFGATASGRNARVSGIDRMAGTVIGTVPVRIRVDANKSIMGFLHDVQRQAVEMMPFEQTWIPKYI